MLLGYKGADMRKLILLLIAEYILIRIDRKIKEDDTDDEPLK